MTELHRRSQAQERRAATVTGGRTQPRSGAGWSRKNDVMSSKFLVECKRTDNRRSITLKATDLEELSRNAAQRGLSPALQFDLNGRHYYVFEEPEAMEVMGGDGNGQVRPSPVRPLLRGPRGSSAT